MSKKFDAEAYVARWDTKVIPVMLGLIVLSLVAVIVLNVKSRPSCLRHEYIFCGTEEVLEAGHEEGHGEAAHGAAAGHGEEHGAHGAPEHAPAE